MEQVLAGSASDGGSRGDEAVRRAQQPSLILESAGEGILGVDPAGTIVFLNPAVTRLTGWDRDTLIGRPLGDVFFPEPPVSNPLRPLLDEGRERLDAEGLFLCRDGRRLTATLTLTAMVDEGAVCGVAIVVRDNTAARQSQAAMVDTLRRCAEQAARFRHLLRTASDGIHVIDIRGNLILASASFYRMLGYPEDDPPPLKVADWDTQWSGDELMERLSRMIALPETFCTRHRRRDGTVFEAEIRCSAIELDGRTYLYASSRDITERLRNAAELARSNAELEQFAYVASHDLRQPLRMISSYLGLIERKIGPDVDEDMKRFLGFALDGARRMDHMIRALLDYSRAGRTAGPLVPVALPEVVAEALLNLEVAVCEAGAAITVAPDLPTVPGDRSELVRLFQNLLGNALTYRAPERPPVIAVGWRPVGAGCEVSVRDNGIGIAPEHHERAFGVFQRMVTREAYEGTGIGLAICRKIVDRHGGRIWIDSQLGQGATFRFTLGETRGNRCA